MRFPVPNRRSLYAARHFIARHNIPLDHPMRFDVLAIDGEEIMHIKNAFETY